MPQDELQFVALVRGMAMFKKRRVKKQEQADLLQRHLPVWITLHGVFGKSGNYALSTQDATVDIGEAVLTALRQHPDLQGLEHVSVIAASTARAELENLVAAATKRYGRRFHQHNFAVDIAGDTWRAGLSFLSDPVELGESRWPVETLAQVIVLSATGRIAFFLKARAEGCRATHILRRSNRSGREGFRQVSPAGGRGDQQVG
jgi:hypothetical protein